MTKAKSYGKGKSLIQSPFCWSTSRSASLEKVSVNSGKNNGKPRKPKRLVRESYTAGTRKNWRNSKPPSRILMLLRKKNGGPGSFWNKGSFGQGAGNGPCHLLQKRPIERSSTGNVHSLTCSLSSAFSFCVMTR